MATYQIIMLIGASISIWVALCWLDTKHQLRFVDWLNGNCSNPFDKQNSRKNSAFTDAQVYHADKDAEIAQLKSRIQVLEKIVTEPAYELDKKLNAL